MVQLDEGAYIPNTFKLYSSADDVSYLSVELDAKRSYPVINDERFVGELDNEVHVEWSIAKCTTQKDRLLVTFNTAKWGAITIKVDMSAFFAILPIAQMQGSTLILPCKLGMATNGVAILVPIDTPIYQQLKAFSDIVLSQDAKPASKLKHLKIGQMFKHVYMPHSTFVYAGVHHIEGPLFWCKLEDNIQQDTHFKLSVASGRYAINTQMNSTLPPEHLLHTEFLVKNVASQLYPMNEFVQDIKNYALNWAGDESVVNLSSNDVLLKQILDEETAIIKAHQTYKLQFNLECTNQHGTSVSMVAHAFYMKDQQEFMAGRIIGPITYQISNIITNNLYDLIVSLMNNIDSMNRQTHRGMGDCTLKVFQYRNSIADSVGNIQYADAYTANAHIMYDIQSKYFLKR